MQLVQLSTSFQSLPLLPTSKLALLVLIPGWVGLCTFWDPVGLSNELSCEAESFSCCRLNPHRCFQSELLRLYFPELQPWVAVYLAPQLFLLVYLNANVGQPGLPAATLLQLLSTSLPNSTLPNGVDECFSFNSLIVGFPYSSIFWQFCLFFVFKFVVVLLLVVRGGTVCLPTLLPWLEVSGIPL